MGKDAQDNVIVGTADRKNLAREWSQEEATWLFTGLARLLLH